MRESHTKHYGSIVPLTPRERCEKFFYEVCEYDNEPFIQAIEALTREIRNEALEEAARIVINRGCAHQDSGKANVLIEAGNAIHTLTLAASKDWK